MNDGAQSCMGRTWRARLAAVAITCWGLAGCQASLAPPADFDAQTLAGLQTSQADADKLFGQLLQPAPACTFVSNAAQFDLVDKDLGALSMRALTIANNSHTQNGIQHLQKAMTDMRAGVSGGAGCPPAGIVQGEQKLFDDGAASLIDWENRKPKGH